MKYSIITVALDLVYEEYGKVSDSEAIRLAKLELDVDVSYHELYHYQAQHTGEDFEKESRKTKHYDTLFRDRHQGNW